VRTARAGNALFEETGRMPGGFTQSATSLVPDRVGIALLPRADGGSHVAALEAGRRHFRSATKQGKPGSGQFHSLRQDSARLRPQARVEPVRARTSMTPRIWPARLPTWLPEASVHHSLCPAQPALLQPAFPCAAGEAHAALSGMMEAGRALARGPE